MPYDNIFDRLKKTTVNIVGNTIGYTATWIPSAGGSEMVARVLFRKPTNKEQFNGVKFEPFDYYCEYRYQYFTGLLAIVRTVTTKEHITVRGVEYLVKEAKAINDGEVIALKLQIKRP